MSSFTSARQALVLGFLVAIGSFGAGCASPTDDTGASEAELSQTLHEPRGEERKAIYAAFREHLSADLEGQAVLFNSADPVGRFQAHGDWASFEGILEGADGNVKPINYQRSVYRDAAAGGYLDGVIRNGNFAAKFFALAHREANGTWKVAKDAYGQPTYAVGPGYEAWSDWAALPPVAVRDVSREFPKDDLHEPVGDERTAILAGLRAVIGPDLNGQAFALNAKDPAGTFLAHDGSAYFDGIIEGPNGNTTAIDFSNSVYQPRAGVAGFEGVLRNGNFAAKCQALLKKQADGSWKVQVETGGDAPTNGYSVGTSYGYVGTPASRFAYDIVPGGRGDGGEGGRGGEGDGDGEGEPAGEK